MNKKIFILIFFLLPTSLTAATLCIPPLDRLTKGGNTVNPENNADAFFIQVDRQPPIELKIGKKTRFINNLDENKNHLIKIKNLSGKTIESFSFNFSKRKQKKLCLLRHDLYATWQLFDGDRSTPICSCKEWACHD